MSAGKPMRKPRKATSSRKKTEETLPADADVKTDKRAGLRESKSLFRTLAETVSAAILIVRDNRIVYANPYVLANTGYSLDEILAMKFWEFAHADFRDKILERNAARQRGEDVPPRDEIKVVNKAGEVRWFDSTATVMNYQGQPALLITGFDITERKSAEKALQESEARWRTLMESAPQLVYTIDREGRILHVNRPAPGLSKEQTIGSFLYDYLSEETASLVRSRVDEVFETAVSASFEIPVAGRKGKEAWYACTLSPVMSDSRVVTAILNSTDITKRKRAEEALQKKAQQTIRHQKALLELAQMDLSDLDEAIRKITEADAATIKVERAGVWFFNEEESEIICADLYLSGKKTHQRGATLRVDLYPRYFESLASNRAIAATDAAADPRTNEFARDHLLPLGVASMLDVPVRLRGKIVGILCHERVGTRREWTPEEQDFAASVADLVSLAIEASQRKRAEEALRASEEKYRELVENLSDVIYAVDSQGRITYISPASEALSGYAPAEVAGRLMSDFLHEEDRPLARQYFKKYLSGISETFECRLITRSGHLRWIRSSGKAVISMGRVTGVQGVITDITERKELEHQLLQSQKMEAIGMLAGGVAHDFNNLLTGILGYTQLILRRLPGSDPMRKEIEEVEKASIQAASLTNQLLAFSRQQILQPRVIDLNDVIIENSRLLRRIIGEDVELVTVLAPDLGCIKADAMQIQQVMLNLAVNARDAMPQGGKLMIETANLSLDSSAHKSVGMIPGPCVMLTVTDTGAGMDEETRQRIFEPFFTTKGRGSGLGLSTVYGIIRQSGGNITVQSEIEKGTNFTIYLPRVNERAEGRAVISRGADLPRGSETILLVEDSKIIRDMASESLRLCGYTVVAAAGSGEALLVCERHEGRIDLLLTDVVMPHLSGPELAERLSRVRPEMKVLYMSGYTDNELARHGIVDMDVDFIQKPFTPTTLSRKVREVLDT
ncbi:MAG: PAS domain S-box protein [Acidobacteriota bacterium]